MLDRLVNLDRRWVFAAIAIAVSAPVLIGLKFPEKPSVDASTLAEQERRKTEIAAAARAAAAEEAANAGEDTGIDDVKGTGDTVQPLVVEGGPDGIKPPPKPDVDRKEERREEPKREKKEEKKEKPPEKRGKNG